MTLYTHTHPDIEYHDLDSAGLFDPMAAGRYYNFFAKFLPALRHAFP